MRVCSNRDQVFGSPDIQVPNSNGWCKSGSISRMASPCQGDRTLILLPFGKLLQKIHQGLFQGSLSSHGLVEEREEVGMGCRVPSCLPKAQGCDHLRANFEIAQLRVSIENTH